MGGQAGTGIESGKWDACLSGWKAILDKIALQLNPVRSMIAQRTISLGGSWGSVGSWLVSDQTPHADVFPDCFQTDRAGQGPIENRGLQGPGRLSMVSLSVYVAECRKRLRICRLVVQIPPGAPEGEGQFFTFQPSSLKALRVAPFFSTRRVFPIRRTIAELPRRTLWGIVPPLCM